MAAVVDDLTPYRDAHEHTSEAIYRTACLARLLYDISLNHTWLGSSDPDAEAIVSLVVVIEEKAKQARELHEGEWAHVVKPAATERGK